MVNWTRSYRSTSYCTEHYCTEHYCTENYGAENYHLENSLASWGHYHRSIVFGFCVLTAIGAISSLWWRSSEGSVRRTAIQSFAEDFQGAEYYPIHRACRLVHTLTEHRVDRRIGIWENWIQWTLGQIHPPLLRTQDVVRILEVGHGDCSERVAVLQHLVRRSRLNTRIVGLGGHVVLEVQANGKWYTADPDYGVVYIGTVDKLATSSPRFLEKPLFRNGEQRDIVERYVSLLQSTEDNVPMPLNSPISPRLYRVEQLSFFMVIAIPCFLWMLWGLMRWNSPRPAKR